MTTASKNPTVTTSTDDTGLRGWPQSLWVIKFGSGRFACHSVNTFGMERDPMPQIRGISTHRTQESAKAYLEAFVLESEIKPSICSLLLYQIRAIAKSKDLDAILLFEKDRCIDAEFIK